jgi:sugar (pentulose or hexulose) kinase
LEEAASQTVQIVDVLEPNPKSQNRYEDYYQLYRSTYNALLPVFDQLAGIPGN